MAAFLALGALTAVKRFFGILGLGIFEINSGEQTWRVSILQLFFFVIIEHHLPKKISVWLFLVGHFSFHSLQKMIKKWPCLANLSCGRSASPRGSALRWF